MTVDRAARLGRIAPLVCAVAMPYGVLALIVKYQVNLPLMDEWMWADFDYHLHRGTLTLGELWAPHNEHRILVPNLVMIALARLGGWFIVREELVGLAFFIACQLLLWRLISRTVVERSAPVTFFCVSALLFSLGQHMNFGYGFQLGWPLCTLSLLIVVTLLSTSTIPLRHVGFAAIAGGVGSYSSAQALLVWPLGIGLLLLARRRSVTAITVWLAAGLVVIAIDHLGRGAPSAQTPFDVGALLGYSLTYLGSPLAGWAGILPAATAGFVCVAAICGHAVGDVVRRDRVTLDRRAPWYALAAYAILAAPITGIARLDSGGGVQALSSRYISISSLLTIALLVLLVQDVSASRRAIVRALAVASIAVLTLLVVPESQSGLAYWQANAAQLETDLAEIRSGNTAAVTDIYPSMTMLEKYVRRLREIGDGPFHP